MANKNWLNIEGSIEIDVNDEQFLKAFYEWLDLNGWSFIGITNLSEGTDED